MAYTSSLRFPREVGTDLVPNFVNFTPMAATFGTYKSLQDYQNNHGSAFGVKTGANFPNNSISIGDISGGLSGALNQITGAGGILDNIANGALANLKSIARGRLNISGEIGTLFGGRVTARLNIGDVIGGFLGEITTTRVTSEPGINLYMPPELGMQLSANYQQSSLNATTIAAIQGYDVISSGESSSTIDNFKEIFKDGATAALTDIFSKGQLGSAVQITTGRAANNYTFRTFNNMEHRSFNYNFRLIAKNSTDTLVIKRICDTFMEYMLPIKSDDELYFFDVPFMWDIKYYHFASENEFIDQPNLCFLENVDIKYGTDSAGHAYSSGAPIDVTISLQFTEVEPLRRDTRGRASTQEDPNDNNSTPRGFWV